MSSANEIPYHLRPNKFIDRELFLELLSRLLPYWGTESYCYFSMGGRHLVDHRMVYRRLGVRNLYSIDLDDDIVTRQAFNRPMSAASCERMLSGELASRYGDLIEEMEGANRGIIWLDYTAPKQRRSQVEEFVTASRQLAVGDVARLTMNANPASLAAEDVWKQERSDLTLPEFRLMRLRDQLGEWVPASITELDSRNFSEILLFCVRNALESAGLLEGERALEPVLSTCYSDGQRMMTITVACIGKDEQLPDGLSEWAFLNRTWGTPLEIVAPDLSLRERFALDQLLDQDADKILEQISFLSAKPARKQKSVRAITSYQRLHRFYPSFQNLDAG